MAEEVGYKTISAAESGIAFEGPALLANRFFVHLWPAGARITFAEQGLPDQPPIFRSAVLLSYQDAIELKNLLQSMLRPVEEAVAAGAAGEGAKDKERPSNG